MGFPHAKPSRGDGGYRAGGAGCDGAGAGVLDGASAGNFDGAGAGVLGGASADVLGGAEAPWGRWPWRTRSKILRMRTGALGQDLSLM